MAREIEAGMPPALARLIALAMLSAATVAQAREISPPMIACHDEATQRYIADFQQVGFRHKPLDGSPILVTTFENTTQRYEEYFAECLKRWEREKAG
jgi:hypothetical protein